MPSYEYACKVHGRTLVTKPMAESSRDEYCGACVQALGPQWSFSQSTGEPCAAMLARCYPSAKLRRIYSVTKQIMRPDGYRRSPDDPKFYDFRHELETGQIREDATPLRFTSAELADFDAMPVALPADPERDAKLAQLHHQHWTEDLSDHEVRKRELLTAAAARGELTPQDKEAL